MNKQFIAVAAIAFIMLLATAISLGFLQPSTIPLDSVEITEYQGEKLSSVNDFRENSIKGTQNVNISNYTLEVTGLVENPKNFTYDEVKSFQNYQKVVKLDCVEGWSVNILWQGVLVKDIVKEVQPSPQANTIIFYAVDGYSTSFPLEYIEKNQIMMAYKMNNVTLPPERGYPFQLVAESKWGYKWIKWINRIELSDNPNYQGYWESRGYSNLGNLNESFLN
ncbi:molybdopterin-dependent oxidoreductase [Methanobacterium petrolearium]|uniref:molybdopterin-dependent oxidoreductase n=1 Tax=Methanobacterium petrolearium TaxID=710190 RepID=UPI001AE1341D|nr:molybdopterin-dependent oxidoreductase [Methanobacterium petrolearium]MBP1945222.1 DMSO/TMAO reductase YedYZ molybdopterin-dependent catalytic subunit [Methanobacterium petrolearium]BDZ71155.1 oxidoreductase [Methanobacterium petrolearium]